MKKSILAAFFICTLGVIFVACEPEEQVTIPPTFKGFLYSPKAVHPGDSVTITVAYENPGQNVYFANHKGYEWTLTVDTLDEEGNSHEWSVKKQPYCSISDGEPKYTFKVPNSTKPLSTATVKFYANYSNACDGEVGLSYPNTTQSGYYGKLSNTVIKSILYTEVSGTLNFTIQE